MKRLLTTVALLGAVVSAGTMSAFTSANADISEYTYTIQDARNLQDFLLARPTTEDLTGKPYDMNNDGQWDAFDLCLMRQEVAENIDTADSNTLEAINNIDLVPAYYEQHLTDKIAEIKRHSADTRFIFITDIHYNGYNNAKHSKSLMTRICREVSSVKHVVHGGDLVNTGTSYTKEDIIRNLNVAADYIRPDAHVRYHSVFGNHDTGEDYPGGVKLPAKLTADEYAVAASAGLSYADEVYDPLNCTQYYFDDSDIRFIVLNANLRELTGETYTNTWRFLARSLISADNKTIVVINHIIRGSNNNLPPFTQTIFDALDAYNARESFTYSGAAFDFSGASGRAAIVIGGHLHKDEDLTTTGGIPVVIVTTDNAGAELPSGIERTIGTTSEQAFDVFSVDTAGRKVYATRIGAGNDRIYEF